MRRQKKVSKKAGVFFLFRRGLPDRIAINPPSVIMPPTPSAPRRFPFTPSNIADSHLLIASISHAGDGRAQDGAG
jgi:hypothetical protein